MEAHLQLSFEPMWPNVREIRQPSYWAVARRLPEVTWNLWKLAATLGRR